ncbi:hypothetical protein AWJ20_5265 [Sugiyamaella lignohabitans]|uniref:SWI5-dependent HO expression protein 3 n=1 Tax=Sugiyamaella lignohabitans TaxID=796027 RepID=A0A161HFI6_9ASCO|nr:uncharacterized protein AWJ20_5265 [Sugiyamaella lignohabitans]ANB14300.1 hypothetical protein AWJ20_5265 [Sugiyamaella lignohabitans]
MAQGQVSSKRHSLLNGVVDVITGNSKNASGATKVENGLSSDINSVKRNSTATLIPSPLLYSPDQTSGSPTTLWSESEEPVKAVDQKKHDHIATPSGTEQQSENKENQQVGECDPNIKTTSSKTPVQTVRIVSGSTLDTPIIIDDDKFSPQNSPSRNDSAMYSSNNASGPLSEAEIPPGDYGRMPQLNGSTKHPSSPGRTKNNDGTQIPPSSPRIIRSNGHKNLNWSSATAQAVGHHSIDAVFDNNKNQQHSHNSPQSPSLATAAAVASLEEQKARKLRDEIAQGSVELQQLQTLLAQLPRLKRTPTRATPEGSLFPSSSHSSHHGNNNSNTAINNASGMLGRSHSVLGTSQVITDLQSKIDILKCQLSEREQIAKDEHDSREALKKRCELIESTLDSLRHQNGNLTQLLTRRERRISELEHEVECRVRDIAVLRQSESHSLSLHVDYQQRILQLQEERDRLEAGYNTVLESSKRMKSKYQDDISDITAKILLLQKQRQSDVNKINSLELRLQDQSIDHMRLLQLQSEMAHLRQQHVGNIDKLFLDMKRTMSVSDHSITTQVDSIQAVIDLIDTTSDSSAATAKSSSTTTTTTTSSSSTNVDYNEQVMPLSVS